MLLAAAAKAPPVPFRIPNLDYHALAPEIIVTATLVVVQFVLAVYGGYFGGAVGIMMMAAWTLLSTSDRYDRMTRPPWL